MAISYELVDGTAFAPQASRVLEEAWSPPALCYTPEYLRWQLSFPGPLPLPAAAALAGNDPVGFAGATWRRLRCGSARWDVAVVSFVAVRPEWRKLGVAAGIYRRLLSALRETGAPIVTYAVGGSAGERLLLRAYGEAGFAIRPLGAYPVYTFMARREPPASDWEVAISTEAASVPGIVEACAADTRILWNDPSEAQFRHYFEDPRQRSLLLLADRRSGTPGAAWAVRLQFRTTRGPASVTTLESVFLSRQCAAALPPALDWAAAALKEQGGVVTAPGLYGFDPNVLRRSGIRQTGAPFQGYLCTADGLQLGPDSRGTSLEVV